MKELTIEEKAKRYDEALKRAKKLYAQGTITESLSYAFPELRESEDERIRKALISFLKSPFVNENITDEKVTPWIVWLEKQGEQKPVTIDIDKMVDDYANNNERDNEEFGKPVGCMIRAYRQGLNDAIRKVGQKPAWSEEDEKHFSWLIEYLSQSAGLYDNLIDWLKSLKDRVGCEVNCTTTREWKPSDEQMRVLDLAIRCGINRGTTEETTLVSLFNDLQKLKS